MPDLEVTVGADVSELLTKLGAAKARLNQLTESQQQFKAGIADLTSSLKLNEKELTGLADKLQKVNTQTRAGAREAGLLKEQMLKLEGNSRLLSASLATAKTELASTTNALKIQTKEVKAAENAGSGFGKGLSKVYGGLRTLANIIPGIGIGGLVGLIAGPVVDAFQDWYNGINRLGEAAQRLKEINQDAAKGAAEQVTTLTVLKIKLDDLSKPAAERIRLAKEYNSIADAGNQINLAEINNLSAINAQIQKQIGLIERQSLAKAAQTKIAVFADKAIEAELNFQSALRETGYTEEQVSKSIQEHEKIISDGLEKQARSLDNFNSSVRKLKPIIPDAAIAQVQLVDRKLENLLIKKKSLAFELENLIKSLLPNISDDAIIHPLKVDKVKPIKEVIEVLKKVHDVIELQSKDLSIKIPVNVTPSSPLEATDIIPPEVQDRMDKLAFLSGAKVGGSFKKGFNFNSLSKEALDKLVANVKAELDAVGSILDNFKVNAAAAIGEAIGNALGGGKDAFKNLFGGIFKELGSALQELGKIALKVGFGMAAIKKAFSSLNPALAIAAGIGLIALGALIKSSIANAAPAFAHGGYINGPGTGTSDSIMARVSRGEYVVRADTVSKFGKSFFDMINRGYIPPKFNSGGIVGSESIGGGQNINVSVYGKLQGRDIVISGQRATNTISRNG